MHDDAAEELQRLGLREVPDISSGIVQVARGTTMFRAGDPCRQYPIVLAGGVRVCRNGLWGQDVVFYRVQAGEGCTVSANCLLEGRHYPAFGVADSDTRLLLLTGSLFRAQLDSNPAFRTFVFHQYSVRIEALMARVDSLLSERPGSRLAKYLLARADNGTVAMTHAELAADIGTAREVVSRHLGVLARAGWIRQHRQVIEILDVAALRTVASEGV